MIDLMESRRKIDEIDQQMVQLFEQRMEIAKDVADYKRAVGKKVFDKEREEEKLNQLETLASDNFNVHCIRELFTQIMSMSRKLQYSMLESYQEDMIFEQIEKINVTKDTKVVYFGTDGSYSQQAMEEYFGCELESFASNTFQGVMEAIKKGEAEFGVLPIENTSTGGITDIYDLLAQYDHYIIGEQVIKVDHALLGLEGATIEGLRKVYSHPQGIKQCNKFLKEYPNMESIESDSTAGSAKKVCEEMDITQGAIASVKAASRYGLTILKECINYEDNNSTRFIIIGKERIFLKKSNKVSICFVLPHESGTLYNMLSHIIFNNLNMTKIESRPLSGKKFEYRFFIDFEGNLTMPAVKNALNGIFEEAIELKILGNY